MKGDTGSPLVQMDGNRAVVIGILVRVSSDLKVCGKSWQYFTQISHFVDWIIDKTRNQTLVSEEPSKVGQMFTSFVIITLLLTLFTATVIVIIITYQSENRYEIN